jgi:hypothetical protein
MSSLESTEITWQSRDGSIVRFRFEGSLAKAVASLPAQQQDFLLDVIYHMARRHWHTHRWIPLDVPEISAAAEREGKIGLPREGQAWYYALLDAIALQEEP